MTTLQATDQRALVAAAQAGDERAFRALIEPYSRAIEVHCYRMLGSLADAEDVTQEVLLRAWRGLSRFERRASVQTWLYRIATNACLDELDRQSRRPPPAVEPYPDERLQDVAAPIADPAARYAQREGMELAFLTAIRRLPGRQRAILILRDVLGWTGPETADLLETTGAGVNSALQRARETIDQELPARTPPPPRTVEADLLRRYVDAWERSDIDALVSLLHEDATLSMPPQPTLAGAPAIGAFFAAVLRGSDIRGRPAWANGRPAVAMWERTGDGRWHPHRLLVLTVAEGAVSGLAAYGDPRVVMAFGP